MMKRLSVFGWVIFLLAWASPVCRAQLDEHVRHHVILSIDAKTIDFMTRDSSMADKALEILFDGPDSLLRKGDLLSIVNYAASEYDPTLSQYISHAVTADGREFIYHPVKDVDEIKTVLKENWKSFATAHAQEICYSLSSIAKPYSLISLPCQGEFTNRTYIILISDEIYNGKDYYQEVGFWQSRAKAELDVESIMQRCYMVENEYFISFIEQSRKGKIQFSLYECRPLQAMLAMPSILSYPISFTPVRVKGKKYRIDFETRPLQEMHYQVKRLDVIPHYSDGSQGKTFSYFDSGAVKESFYFTAEKKVDSLLIRAWVQLKDGFYNAVILTPSADAPSFLGRDGLNVAVLVQNAEEAKIFRWRLPEMLWVFYPNDPFKCAFMWEVIFVALVALGIALLLRSLRTYRPKKNQVHLY